VDFYDGVAYIAGVSGNELETQHVVGFNPTGEPVFSSVKLLSVVTEALSQVTVSFLEDGTHNDQEWLIT